VIQPEEKTENLIVSLTGGVTGLVIQRPPSRPEVEQEVPLQGSPTAPKPIYTEEKDMPSLERLLEENRVAYAVFEREARAVSGSRVAVASGIAAIVAAVGWTLVVVDVTDGGRLNPYLALMLALGGLVLCATVLVALRDR
jgi:hypothetical protein